ncbi:MAG: Na+/H+ antiporter NhaC family protein [Planctomycetota bacterium]
MTAKVITRGAVAVIIFAVICALAASLAPTGPGSPGQRAMWYSIVPPLLAIVLAFLTRHVLASLGIAILVGGVLTQVPQAPLSAAAWLEGFKTSGMHLAATVTNRTNLTILSFIPPIFVMIEVLIASGGFRGIIVWLLKWIRGRKSAQAATALMGILCFIDDYTNAIVVGSMMQPITDRFRVSREKLAFLVDATSAPIAGLAVISTWIAYEVSLLTAVGQQLGIEKSGYAMFFDALSFRFYCLLMIAFVFAHSLLGRDFGPMKTAEQRAQDAEPEKESESTAADGLTGEAQKSGRAINALVPLAGLVLFHLTGLWYDGTSALKAQMHDWQAISLTTAAAQMPAKPVDIEALSPGSWVYWREVIGHAQNTPLVLACAAIFGLTLALLFARFGGNVSMPVIKNCFRRGVRRAMIPFVILILAWSLKNCCDALRTGEFLAAILAGRVPPYLFPPILFVVASVTSFATGTSYGTMAILIPTAVPIAFAIDGGYGLTTMISLGAVLDGAIFGDHCSPISDTTIMSSIASNCDLIDHVRTQLPYSLFVAALALLFAYVPSSLGLATRWSLVLAISVMVCLLVIMTGRILKSSKS